ncbi:MAG: ribonucleoside-diphosphate reductase subunit alpha, partial [Anaerococcus vaginalis]|nr:ribonucleoside-diphosphate reductase subunit alpha [Anaerococcus vaginalis]
AKEKGSYSCFDGSDWDNGDYFKQRGYESERWENLKKDVHENGLRNGYLLAVAPTGSTSIISGTSAGVDPIMNKYFLEEKKGAIVPRVAPGLNTKTFWLYENAYNIDQNISMRACGVRQRHIDQAQSVNVYITTEYTMRQILNIYLTAWEAGVKSLYYVRGKSLEVEDCDSCAS